jgi:hypothetical protein
VAYAYRVKVIREVMPVHTKRTIRAGLGALKYKKELNIIRFLLLIERKVEISKETKEAGLTKP